MKIETVENLHHFDIQLFFNDANPEYLKVELFCEAISDTEPNIQSMKRCKKIKGAGNGYHFQTTTSSQRSASDYTARIIPNIPGASAPLETNLILWQN